MTDLNFIYLGTLATIQPARVQDVERYAMEFFRSIVGIREGAYLRDVHQYCIEAHLILPVRKGVYVVSKQANELIRTGLFGKGVDNRRLFLLKQIRKGIK